VFKSPVSESFKASLSTLHASGIDLLLQRSREEVNQYRAHVTRVIMERLYPTIKKIKKERDNNRFSSNMIHLENCFTFLYTSGVLLLIAIFIFVFENLNLKLYTCKTKTTTFEEKTGLYRLKPILNLLNITLFVNIAKK